MFVILLIIGLLMNERIYLSLCQESGFEKEYITKALTTQWITTGGSNVDEFENVLENYLGEKSFVSALNSGTSAIHLALILLGVDKDDEVICQSMTFSASANPILYQKATPVFVDSESDTWNICPQQLELAIKDRIRKGNKPKAIIAVHLYGNPYKVDEIHAIADKYSIPVIEDSAEALGSSYKGRKCGTFGDLSIFSFNGNKIITTSSGGALVTRNLSQKKKAIFYSTQAKDPATHYQHSEIGYNYRMSNICAGVGLGQIKVLNENILRRKENHKFYKEIFDQIEDVELLQVFNEDYQSIHWLNAILILPQSRKRSEDLRIELDKENIESRPLWKPMHLQPIFEKYPYYGGGVAESLFETGLCLPSGSNLAREEKKRIKKVILNFFKK